MARCLTDRSPLFGGIQSNKVWQAASLLFVAKKWSSGLLSVHLDVKAHWFHAGNPGRGGEDAAESRHQPISERSAWQVLARQSLWSKEKMWSCRIHEEEQFNCRTVLDVCEELETQRTRDITKIILNFAQDDKEVWSQFQLVPWLSINVHLLKGPAMEPISPYDNVSIASSLEATSHQSPIRPRAPSWHTRYHLSTLSYVDYRRSLLVSKTETPELPAVLKN